MQALSGFAGVNPVTAEPVAKPPMRPIRGQNIELVETPPKPPLADTRSPLPTKAVVPEIKEQLGVANTSQNGVLDAKSGAAASIETSATAKTAELPKTPAVIPEPVAAPESVAAKPVASAESAELPKTLTVAPETSSQSNKPAEAQALEPPKNPEPAMVKQAPAEVPESVTAESTPGKPTMPEVPEQTSGARSTSKPDMPEAPKASERAIDEYLRDAGHDVKLNLKEGKKDAGPQGDRIIDGKLTEYKALSGVKKQTADGLSSAIANRIMNGRRQASEIIVDVRNQSGMTKEIAERGIRRAYGADDKQTIQSIRIIGKDFDLIVPRSE